MPHHSPWWLGAQTWGPDKSGDPLLAGALIPNMLPWASNCVYVTGTKGTFQEHANAQPWYCVSPRECLNRVGMVAGSEGDTAFFSKFIQETRGAEERRETKTGEPTPVVLNVAGWHDDFISLLILFCLSPLATHCSWVTIAFQQMKSTFKNIYLVATLQVREWTVYHWHRVSIGFRVGKRAQKA